MSKAKISKIASEKKTKPVPSRGVVAKEKVKAPAKATPAKATSSKVTPAKVASSKAAPAKATPAKAAPAKAAPTKAASSKATPAKAAPASKVTASKVSTAKVSTKMSEEKAVKSKTKITPEEKPKSKAKTVEKKAAVEKKTEKKSKPKSTPVNKAKTRAPAKSASEEKAKAKPKVAAPKSKAKPAKSKTTKEAPKAKAPAKKKSKAVTSKPTPAKTVAAEKKPTKTTSKKSSPGSKKKSKKATKVEGGKGGSVASEPEASSSNKGKTSKKSATSSKASKKKAEPKAQKTAVKKSSAKTKGVKKKARAKKVALAGVELEETAPEVVADEPLPKEQTEEFRTSLKGSYKFSVPAMLALLDLFVKRAKLTDEEGMKIVGVETAKRYNEYRNFLFTGDFIDRGGKSFIKTEKLDKLWEAFKSLDYRTIADYLNQVPSFFSFLGNLKVGTASLLKDIPSISKSAYPTYCTLAEIAGVALNIADEGIYLTNRYPSIDDFAKMALESYNIAQAKTEKTVLTGLWLETLAKESGIHPMTARQLLQQAQQEELLKVSLEGTTSPNQFRKHIMYYLNLEKGVPTLQQLNLYNGDFITSDRTSVNILIEGIQ